MKQPAFPLTRKPKAPHWSVQAAIGFMMAGAFLLACFL